MRTTLNLSFESFEDYEKFTAIVENAILESNNTEQNPEYLIDTNYSLNKNGSKTIKITKNHNFNG